LHTPRPQTPAPDPFAEACADIYAFILKRQEERAKETAARLRREMQPGGERAQPSDPTGADPWSVFDPAADD
jgi:hypothetical protein